MIAEYKLYHGAVLSELVDQLDGTVLSLRSYQDSRRLLNYVIGEAVGIQIKHASQRLHPWQFTFPEAHLRALSDLLEEWQQAFLVLVCHTDGMVCVPVNAAVASLTEAPGSQAWLRVDRHRRTRYRVYGPSGEFASKFPSGLDLVIEAIKSAGY